MFNNPYMPSAYNPQATVDKINAQINELERLKTQIPQNNQQQPTSLTQNFQLAPQNHDVIKYARCKWYFKMSTNSIYFISHINTTHF